MSVDDRPVRELVERLVTAAGYDLEQLTITTAGRRRQVKVVVDSDHGVDLDHAAELSRSLSEALDGAESDADTSSPLGSAPYVLEVTSPGVGRPLTLPRHFRRARGRLLALTTSDGEQFVGRVRRAGDSDVELLVGPTGLDPRTVEYAQISKARVEVEFAAPSAAVTALLGQDDQREEAPE